MVSFTRTVRGTGMADRLDFEVDVELETGLITGHAGVPGLIEAFRQTGTAAVIDKEIKLKTRKWGLRASEVVQSLLAMWAAGGERVEDLDQFRQDNALALLLGHELPAAQTARDFLGQFHAEDLPALQEGKAPVTAETAPLLGLAKANAELVLDLQCRRSVKTATLDVVADEFRDGNVPTGSGKPPGVREGDRGAAWRYRQDRSARRQRALRARADALATRSRPI